MSSGLLERAQLLLNQGRFQDAENILKDYLELNAEDRNGRVMFLACLISLGKKEESQLMAEQLLSQYPDDIEVLKLATENDMSHEHYQLAESRAQHLIGLAPFLHSGYHLLSRIKIAQRNYDKALFYIEKALEIEPESVKSLNTKVMLTGFLQKGKTQADIQQVLQLDPENPYTIANHALELLRNDDIGGALDRAKEALSIQPSNQIAKFAMSEALKSKFPPYKWFFKYKEKMAAMSEKGFWLFLIGIYFIYRILLSIARNNEAVAPFIFPIVGILVFLFISSWLFDPLMNLYLLLNPYGKYLLDQDDIKMAKFTGGSLGVGIILLTIGLLTNMSVIMICGGYFLLMMIPLGSFLNVNNPRNRKIMKFYILGLLGLGILGLILVSDDPLLLGLILIFIYQWVITGMLIKENSAVYD